MKKLIDLTDPIKNLNGEPLKEIKNAQGVIVQKPESLAKCLARGLGNTISKKHRMKIYQWIDELIKRGKLELDIEDFNLFKTEVENLNNICNLIIGQILLRIHNATDINIKNGKKV